jgi:hypothetical protein
MLPILLGAIVGYIVAIPLGLVDFSLITQAQIIEAPHITFPSFTNELSMTAIASIAIMAIATIRNQQRISIRSVYMLINWRSKRAEKKVGLKNMSAST